MPNKLTDTEVKKALKGMTEFADMVNKNVLDMVDVQTLKNALDLINRLQAENKKFKDRQKPTGASGYKIENGKVVFFTNMLGGCKIVKENLEDVVKTLNELLHEAYSKDEIAFALKCKTEENESLKAEVERLEATIDSFTDIGKLYSEIKAEAYKEFAKRLKESKKQYEGTLAAWTFTMTDLDNLLNELVNDN